MKNKDWRATCRNRSKEALCQTQAARLGECELSVSNGFVILTSLVG